MSGQTRRKVCKSGRLASTVTLPEVLALQHLPIELAAAEVGVCVTTFKKVCRKLGIQRWPFRSGSTRPQPSGSLPALPPSVPLPRGLQQPQLLHSIQPPHHRQQLTPHGQPAYPAAAPALPTQPLMLQLAASDPAAAQAAHLEQLARALSAPQPPLSGLGALPPPLPPPLDQLAAHLRQQHHQQQALQQQQSTIAELLRRLAQPGASAPPAPAAPGAAFAPSAAAAPPDPAAQLLQLLHGAAPLQPVAPPPQPVTQPQPSMGAVQASVLQLLLSQASPQGSPQQHQAPTAPAPSSPSAAAAPPPAAAPTEPVPAPAPHATAGPAGEAVADEGLLAALAKLVAAAAAQQGPDGEPTAAAPIKHEPGAAHASQLLAALVGSAG